MSAVVYFARWVLNSDMNVVENGAVVVEDGRIADVGLGMGQSPSLGPKRRGGLEQVTSDLTAGAKDHDPRPHEVPHLSQRAR